MDSIVPLNTLSPSTPLPHHPFSRNYLSTPNKSHSSVKLFPPSSLPSVSSSFSHQFLSLLPFSLRFLMHQSLYPDFFLPSSSYLFVVPSLSLKSTIALYPTHNFYSRALFSNVYISPTPSPFCISLLSLCVCVYEEEITLGWIVVYNGVPQVSILSPLLFSIKDIYILMIQYICRNKIF